MPCNSASASSTPIAKVGSIGSDMYELINASRPNRVMYHGAPAAMTGRWRPVGSCKRNAAMSSIERSYAALELPVGAAQLRNRCQPPLVALRRVGQVRVVVPALDPGVAEGDGEIELQHADTVRLDVDAPQEPVRRYLHRRSLDDQLRLAMNLAQPPTVQQAVLFDLQRVLALDARPPFLDGEDVGKVRSNLQLDDRRHTRRSRVAQLDLFVPHRSQLSPAHDEDSRVGLVLSQGTAHKGAPTCVDKADGERLDRDAAHEQPGLTEHTHVGEEDSMRRVCVEVARTSAETERLAIDQCDETGWVTETRGLAGEHPRARLHLSRIH